jgi:DNA mismatch repair protein MutL
MRDVKDAAHPRGTTVTVRDLFFNVPARRKFLRSESTETFHLTNLVTHYALAHPEISFTFSSNGREVIRAAPAKDLRERAYQIFGEEFLNNLLDVNGGHEQIARVSGFVSAPRDRRTSRDAQYLFVNGRFVRDRLLGRALSEGYRAILPHGVYPAALLFLETPLEEVDVNVHPAKTEVRFRRAAAVGDAVRQAVRAALASAGYVRAEASPVHELDSPMQSIAPENTESLDYLTTAQSAGSTTTGASHISMPPPTLTRPSQPIAQPRIDFPWQTNSEEEFHASGMDESSQDPVLPATTPSFPDYVPTLSDMIPEREVLSRDTASVGKQTTVQLPPLNSADKLAREVVVESISTNIRPLGQLDESFIIATDDEGLLLIDQHVAHERILFDKYRALESTRKAESQQLLIPETFDLTPAQAAAYDLAATELESYGFDLMRLSGRTVAIKATPADLPESEARNMLAEILDTVDAEKKGSARENLRDEIAASLACHAAIKVNMPLAPEKMRWLIDRLLVTSSPTTCPHGRPVILRLATRDILKGFHRV